jgi:hypothetical protein
MWDQTYKRKAPEKIENKNVVKKLDIEIPDISSEVAKADQALKGPSPLGDLPNTHPDAIYMKASLGLPLSREEKVISKMMFPPNPNDPITSEEKEWILHVIPGIKCPCLD